MKHSLAGHRQLPLRDPRYHVIVLSNFARGFDKYALAYGKAGIPESRHPDRFHLLTRDDLAVGASKAQHLLDRLAIPGNRLLALETAVCAARLSPNKTTGLGKVFHDDRIQLSAIYDLDRVGDSLVLRPTTIEDAMAASLAMHGQALHRYTDVRPRAISFLPIASACQARCTFCFSTASISADQDASKIDWDKVQMWLRRAHLAGAERAVITGGGEPTLLPADQLQRLIAECSKYFGKTVLITNAHILAMGNETDHVARLEALSAAGLSVLAISRHHEDDSANEKLMGLRTPVGLLARTWREQRSRWPELRLRLICVLQRGGVASDVDIAAYLTWAAELGVEEICFKELYVSTSTESVYFDRAANTWSRDHQVSLSIVTWFAEQHGFDVESHLPWGAPIYRGVWRGHSLRIAAYTEPSLLWERTEGIARSWNVMADGRCFASLEDRASEIDLESAA